MKISLNKNKLKFALYFYTFLIIIVSVLLAFTFASNNTQTYAQYAPGDGQCVGHPTFNTIKECTDSCIAGAQGDQAWINGCYNACVAICDGSEDTVPPSCGNGTFDPPGETPENCPQDYNPEGGSQNPPTDGQTNPVPYPYDVTYCNPKGTGTTACELIDATVCNSWNVYECVAANACYTFTDGCPNGLTPWTMRGSGVDYVTAMGYLNETLTCGVRQADCTTSNLYISRVNCTGNCAISNPPLPAENPPYQPPANPPQSQQVACNDECNNTDRLCPSNLSCTNIAGINRCRLPSNINSASCQPADNPPVTVACNEICNNSTLLCPSNLTCTTIDGENRCRLPANLSSQQCLPLEVPPNYIIEKIVEGNQGPFNIGDAVKFKIRITNTGQTTLTNVRFRDVYNYNYLTYVGGSAIKSSGGSISDINTVLTLRINGEIQIENVAANNILGPLAPGNYYEFNLTFIAKTPVDNTCNVGYALTPNLPEISDDACVSSRNIDTDL